MDPRTIVERGTILRATVGSTVHGLHRGGQDDRDEMAVFVEPPEYLLGLARRAGSAEPLRLRQDTVAEWRGTRLQRASTAVRVRPVSSWQAKGGERVIARTSRPPESGRTLVGPLVRVENSNEKGAPRGHAQLRPDHAVRPGARVVR